MWLAEGDTYFDPLEETVLLGSSEDRQALLIDLVWRLPRGLYEW